MTVKVVTDSICDMPPGMLQELGITMVPVYVIFGQKAYRDRVDISEEEFYNRLLYGPVYPTTSVPTPQDFTDAYNKLARETDEIISIHASAKLSGIYNSAMLGVQMMAGKCRIEVLDSKTLSIGFGLSVLAAAREAKEGKDLEQVTQATRQAILHIHERSMTDTLKYAVKGGRVNRAYGLIGSFLGVKPIMGMRDGVAFLAGVARTRAKALQRMYEFAASFPRAQEIALGYTTEYDDAKFLAGRLETTFPGVPVHIARVCPAVAVYGGPGSLGMAVRESENKEQQ
jgi:fatty acid kinase fatty acid binding subunit